MSNTDPFLRGPTQTLDVMHHDSPSRHLIGGTLLAPGPPKPNGAVASPGISDAPAREDHVHSGAVLVAFVQGTASNLGYNNNAGALVTVFTLPSAVYVAGHRYIIEFNWRAASGATFWQLTRDGVDQTSWDFYHDTPNINTVNWMGGRGSWYWNDTGSHTLSIKVRSQNTQPGNIYADAPTWAGVFDWG